MQEHFDQTQLENLKGHERNFPAGQVPFGLCLV